MATAGRGRQQRARMDGKKSARLERTLLSGSACHGPGGYKIGAPTLSGQYAAYIERQVAGFSQGIRQNDIYEQMRAIARTLTPEEIYALAAFYGSRGRELVAKD